MIIFDKELLKENEPDFLPESGTVAGKQTYVCPNCGNGSGNNQTGIVRYGNRYKCFSCDGNYDIIDLAMIEYNMEWEKAVKWLCDRYGIDYKENNNKSIRKTELSTPEADYKEYINKAKANNNYEYLLSRGISKEIQDKFNIGFDEQWRHPKVNASVPSTPRCIIPTSDHSYLARDTRPVSELNDTQQKYIKSKVGTVHIFNEDELNQATDHYLFITEGEIDAMSIEELGYPAVGLGSAANKEKLIDKMAENHCYWNTIFIVGDSDATGKAASAQLKNELVRNEFCDIAVTLDIPYKDPNEFLVKDREGFKKFLLNKLHEYYRKNVVYVDDERMKMLEEMAETLDEPIEDILENAISSYVSNFKHKIKIRHTP